MIPGRIFVRSATFTEMAFPNFLVGVEVAWRMQKEIPHAVVLDQYANVYNPLAHYQATAAEIIEDVRSTVSVAGRARASSVDRFIDDSSMMAGLPTTIASSDLSQDTANNAMDDFIDDSSMMAGLPTTIANSPSSSKNNGVMMNSDAEKENVAPPSPASSRNSKIRPRGNTFDKLVNGSSKVNGLPTTQGSRAVKKNGMGNGTITAPPRPSTGKVDVLVAGAGTGGSISGISKRLKEEWNDVIVVGIDPIGSILAQPESLNALKEGESTYYAVEGIGKFPDSPVWSDIWRGLTNKAVLYSGYEFIPQVLDRSLVDTWQKVNDEASFDMTRRIIRTEGLLIGGSSGCAMAGAIEYLTNTAEGRRIAQQEGANVVVIMPDRCGRLQSLHNSWLSLSVCL